MRVIGGTAKGIALQAVPGSGTRPILDRVKESLFNILRPRLQDIAVLDLFAGSGSVGIEALSEGANHCTFLDISAAAIKTITHNLAVTDLSHSALVKKMDAFGFMRRTHKSFSLIYVAPPQYRSLWIEAMHAIAERPELVEDSGEIIVQIDPKEYEELELTCFEETRQKKYGNTLLVFYNKIIDSQAV